MWKERDCPHCGALAGEYCRSDTGKRTSLPHKVRDPDSKPRTYGRALARKQRLRAQRLEEAARAARKRLPLDLAVRDITHSHIAAWRERREEG